MFIASLRFSPLITLLGHLVLAKLIVESSAPLDKGQLIQLFENINADV